MDDFLSGTRVRREASDKFLLKHRAIWTMGAEWLKR